MNEEHGYHTGEPYDAGERWVRWGAREAEWMLAASEWIEANVSDPRKRRTCHRAICVIPRFIDAYDSTQLGEPLFSVSQRQLASAAHMGTASTARTTLRILAGSDAEKPLRILRRHPRGSRRPTTYALNYLLAGAWEGSERGGTALSQGKPSHAADTIYRDMPHAAEAPATGGDSELQRMTSTNEREEGRCEKARKEGARASGAGRFSECACKCKECGGRATARNEQGGTFVRCECCGAEYEYARPGLRQRKGERG